MADHANDLEPEHPREEGVDAPEPGTMTQEGVHLLANEAWARLEDEGFDRDEVYEWAAAYIAEDDAGTVEDFIAWIRAEER